jgi:DNA modification methylase
MTEKSLKNIQTSQSGGLKSAIQENQKAKPNTDFLETLKEALPQYFQRSENAKTSTGQDNDANPSLHFDTFNVNKFLEDLRQNNIEEARDGYKLSFVGKDYAKLQTAMKSETMFAPDAPHNAKPENAHSGNIFITGDNLEALRHLQNAYAKQIKMIYIDPPYNTGKEFTYNDEFKFSDEKLKSALGYTDDDIARLKTLQNKSSHSAWLTFMYPRLKLAQKLLKDDGVIFVSIDDNEQANLKLLMDDIFGEGNLVCNFIWESKYTVSNDAKWISDQHEYVLCYAKCKTAFVVGRLERTEEQNKGYRNPDNDPKGAWKATPLHAKSGTENSKYEITFENGKTWKCPQGRFPRYSKDHLRELYKTGQLSFNASGGIDKKTYLTEVSEKGVVVGSVLNYEKVGHTHGNNEELASLIGKGIFDNPKGTKLIQHLIKIANVSASSFVLDFFAGSGTTADAVMKFNSNNPKLNLKFICVQIDAEIDKNSEASKAGYNTIDEIARERIQRAAAKIKKENPDKAETLDLGFKHYRLISPDALTLEKIETFAPDQIISNDMIAPFAYSATKTSGEETLLATWLIDDGNAFDAKVEDKDFAGYPAHYVPDAQTLYLIAQGFTTKALEAMLNAIGKYELPVSTIVVYPYSFEFERMRELETGVNTTLDHPPRIVKRY